jgi:hypothetical protein
MSSLEVRLEMLATREAERIRHDEIAEYRKFMASDPAEPAKAWADARANLPAFKDLDADLSAIGKAAAAASPKVAEAAKGYSAAWAKFEAVIAESVDSGLVRDETVKLISARDAQWKSHSEASIRAIVLRVEMLHAHQVRLTELAASAEQLKRSGTSLEKLAAVPERKVASPVPTAPAASPMRLTDADGRIFTRITKTEIIEVPEGADVTVDTDETPVQKASEPAQPTVLQLQLPDVLATKLMPPASSNDWEAVWDALEDGATYRFDKQAGTLEQVEDGRAAESAGRAADVGSFGRTKRR